MEPAKKEEPVGGEPPPPNITPKSVANALARERELAYGAVRRIGRHLLQHPHFDHVMGLVIAINFLVVIVETDFNAKDEPPPLWAFYASYSLLTIFVMELILKLFVLRRKFVNDNWNCFDFLVICVDLIMSVLEVLGLELINVSMLRILRLSRLARATKVLRVFPELRLMLAGLGGAMQAIFWGTVLLMVALLVWSVLAVQFIHPLNQKIAEDVYIDCPRCGRAYESTFQACLTFTTQIVAGDSWGRETVPIIEAYPPTALFFMSVFVSVGLAILNLILGVVVNVATEARDGLLQEMADEKLLARMESHNQLLTMCEDMDEDGNDELTFVEIIRGFETNEMFRDTLASMDIQKDDLSIVWTILDSDRSGTVTSKEFVSQVYKMKNSDTQFMLAYIKYYITEIKDKLRDDLFKISARLDKDMEIIESDMKLVECEVDHIDKEMETVLEHVQKIDAGQHRMESPLQSLEANTEQMEGYLQRIEEETEEHSEKLEAEAGAMAKQNKEIALLRLERDRLTAARMNEPEDLPAATCAKASKRSEAAAFFNCNTENGEVGKSELVDSIDTLLEKGSLEAMFERLDSLEIEGALPVAALARLTNPDEVLTHLEGIWRTCIISVEDMRHFHSNLADLLEAMIKRVSLSISQTVRASMQMSGASGRYFTTAYRLSDGNAARQKHTPRSAAI